MNVKPRVYRIHVGRAQETNLRAQVSLGWCRYPVRGVCVRGKLVTESRSGLQGCQSALHSGCAAGVWQSTPRCHYTPTQLCCRKGKLHTRDRKRNPLPPAMPLHRLLLAKHNIVFAINGELLSPVRYLGFSSRR